MLTEKVELVLERASDGRLLVFKDGERLIVSVARCFPWSDPGAFISLRDEGGEEVALVEDINVLPDKTRVPLQEALCEAGFLLNVLSVQEIEEEVEIRNWKVTTTQGPRTFQTKLDEWPRRTARGGLLIRDVAGDLYVVSNIANLDAASAKVLSSFID